MGNKYRLDFSISLNPDTGAAYNTIMERLEVRGLSFFQVCVILGGLQCLIDEAKRENEG